MKKFYLGLFAVLVAFNAQAFDLAGSLNKTAAKVDEATAKVEAKKAEANAKADEAAAKVEAQKAEAEAKAEAQKAESDAKKAEQDAAVKNVKDSVDGLKKALTE